MPSQAAASTRPQLSQAMYAGEDLDGQPKRCPTEPDLACRTHEQAAADAHAGLTPQDRERLKKDDEACEGSGPYLR